MKSQLLKITILLPFVLAGCDSQLKEEEVDYDRMVQNEANSEWTSSPECDSKVIAGDLYPQPQEVIVHEAVDAPSPLDSSTVR